MILLWPSSWLEEIGVPKKSISVHLHSSSPTAKEMDEPGRVVQSPESDMGPAQKECRICFDSEETPENKLFRPCLCRGTQAFVHEECLNQWRLTTHNSSSFYACPTCGYRYRIDRIWYSHFFTHKATISVITFLFIILAILFVAYFIKTAAFLFFGVKMTKNIWTLSSKLVMYAMMAIGFLTLIAVLLGGDNDMAIGLFFLIQFMNNVFCSSPYLFFPFYLFSFSAAVYLYFFFFSFCFSDFLALSLILYFFGSSISFLICFRRYRSFCIRF